jgi:hypothetical protein
MNARRLMWVLAGSCIVALPAHAEDLDCRWYIPAVDQIVRVRCADTDHPSPPAQKARTDQAQPSSGQIDRTSIIPEIPGAASSLAAPRAERAPFAGSFLAAERI